MSKFSTNSPSKEGVCGQIEELSLNQRELSLKMGRETVLTVRQGAGISFRFTGSPLRWFASHMCTEETG